MMIPAPSCFLLSLQSEKLQADKNGLRLLASLLCPDSLHDRAEGPGGASNEGEEAPINLSSFSAVKVGCRGVWGPREELQEFLRAQGRGVWGGAYECEVEKVRRKEGCCGGVGLWTRGPG